MGTAECLCEGDEPGVLPEACLREATLASRRTCSRWRLSSRCWAVKTMLWCGGLAVMEREAVGGDRLVSEA